MALGDIFRILIGRKTEAEREVEARFQRAVETHKGANGQVKELREKLQKARDGIHARIEVLSVDTGGRNSDDCEAQRVP